MPTSNQDALTLKSSERRVAQLVVFSIAAAIFDAALAVVIWQTIVGNISLLFAIFFGLIWGFFCLLLTVGALREFLKMFNPRITLSLSRAGLSPGTSAELKWNFEGRYDRIQKLTLKLEGRERATYRRGTDTRTDTNVFTTVPLFETERNDQMAQGKCALRIPAGTMHSFKAPHNEIRWVIVVHGDIAGWPDVSDSFDIEVPPGPVSTTASASATSFEIQPASSGVTLVIAGDQRGFAPGQPIGGVVAWAMSPAPRNIEVRLGWSTSGKGTVDTQTAQHVAVPNTQTPGRHYFNIPAPNGPYSFSGKLISLTWNLSVSVDGKSDDEQIDIVCAPSGKEIILPAAPAPVNAK